MPSEIFTGHTFTKIKDLVKRAPLTPVVYRDSDTKGLAVKVLPTPTATRPVMLTAKDFTHF